MKSPTLYEAAAGQSHLRDAFTDFLDGLQQHAIWRELVRRDIYGKTKGANLGKWWILIGQAIAIAGLGTVYSQLFGFPAREYIPYLAVGFVTWRYVIGLIGEASEVFVSSKGFLMQSRLPLSACIFRFVVRNIILFAYKSPIILVVLVLFQVPIGWSAPVALVGVALIAVAGFFTGIVLGLINARWRDIGQFVSSITFFLFFMTPIIWKPANRLGDLAWIVDYNPLHHFVDLVRAPLIGDPIAWWSFVMTGGSIAVLAALAAFVYKRFGHEVIYWL